MKKVLFACMTVVVFASCSSDEEVIPEDPIEGRKYNLRIDYESSYQSITIEFVTDTVLRRLSHIIQEGDTLSTQVYLGTYSSEGISDEVVASYNLPTYSIIEYYTMFNDSLHKRSLRSSDTFDKYIRVD